MNMARGLQREGLIFDRLEKLERELEDMKDKMDLNGN
jgi:hypothetical protein